MEFVKNFRFQKGDIMHVCDAMGLEQVYHSTTKLKWQHVKGLCMLIRWLAYPNRLCELHPLFGRHVTEMSVIINCMTKLLLQMHGNKLLSLGDNPWFDPEWLARAVHAKGAVMPKVWGFMDGTVGPIS